MNKIEALIQNHKKILEVGIFCTAILIVAFVLSRVFEYFLPYAFTDWKSVFYQAGQHPFSIYHSGSWQHAYNNPPWLAWVIAPFSLFSVTTGLALWITLSILVTVWGLMRQSARLFTVCLVLCSPGFFRLVAHGQIDAFIYFGFVLLQEQSLKRQQLGLLIMAIKPQILGFGAVVYLVYSPNKWKIIMPTAVLTLLSFLIYGFWPLHIVQNSRWVLDEFFNISLWPYGIPIGIVLLGISFWKRNVHLGALSTLFLTPYFATHSLFPYTAVLMPMLNKKGQLILFVFLWLFFIFVLS